MVDHVPQRISTNLQDGFSNCGGPEELYSIGVSGTCCDVDSDEGKLPIPTCQVHYDHTGGGQPPPPTVPTVQHDSALEGPEWAACHHHSVCQGWVAEETAAGRIRDVGEHGEGFSDLLKASCVSHLVQIHGAGLDGGG